MATRSPTERKRRSAQETRQLLLEAGTRLAVESFEARDARDSGPLAHIRAQDVARKASELSSTPVTTGALYNLWPSQREYQVDLMFSILRRGAFPGAGHVASLASQLLEEQVPFDELGVRLSDESFRAQLQSPFARAVGALTALAGVPEIRDALRAGHDELMESARELYTHLLAYGGLQVRAPYSLDQLITVVGALNDGMAQAYAVVPEVFDVPDGSSSLIATSVGGIFALFCEPADH